MFINKITFSNSLIFISIIFTILWYIFPGFVFEWWINNYSLVEWNSIHWFIQFFSWTFLHWSTLHILMNSIFIYYFWNILELIIWKNKLIIFFILSVTFNWILLSQFAWMQNTIWISWFALSIVTYYTLHLKSLSNIEYKWWITVIVLSVLMGLYPWISFYWHLFWIIFWVIFYYISNDFRLKKLIWLFRYKKVVNNSDY